MHSARFQPVRLPVQRSQGLIHSQLNSLLGIRIHLHVGGGYIFEGDNRINDSLAIQSALLEQSSTKTN